MRIAKLFVPSGTPVHDNCGDTSSPTQLGLFGTFAVLLATFFGSMVPSLKVVEVSANTSAALATWPTRPNIQTAAPTSKRLRFTIMMFSPYRSVAYITPLTRKAFYKAYAPFVIAHRENLNPFFMNWKSIPRRATSQRPEFSVKGNSKVKVACSSGLCND